MRGVDQGEGMCGRSLADHGGDAREQQVCSRCVRAAG